ncbi:uncharacterized protein Z520_08440 [Fonsecaea multimorphosa CBS 102226]|uniref:Uncharacterized protein n=1 Tax=Fonsecaea multimorphosa CBS 102226 TaxID=1442371 RepID=A0A0D2JQU5_9EURO|nr:uncharacterized protein Z520_08440 [Fonsecaea multimorphosa CBS 102226]KIX95732.1 hypothetical protein Z520_08440 [Fonsecaea multimorphosa CBS 102226]OAL21471.1 hypothetical protein AYO22_07867 [Fonsecaea multimorphosa]
MAQLQGKVIAISGAGSGIGLATARECADRGAILALSDINPELLNKVVEELEAKKDVKVKGTVVDVSDSQSVDAWIVDTVEHFGRLDGAANVAGVETRPGQQRFSRITDISDDHWDFVNRINLTGTFYCLRAELRVIQAGGSIVNVSSMAGLIGVYGLGSYVASKHGVIGLSRTAAKEFGEKGIRVNVLAPGSIDTPMLSRLRSDQSGIERPPSVRPPPPPLQRLGTATDMAKTICFILSDDSSFTTGAVFSADGGVVC